MAIGMHPGQRLLQVTAELQRTLKESYSVLKEYADTQSQQSVVAREQSALRSNSQVLGWISAGQSAAKNSGAIFTSKEKVEPVASVTYTK